MNEKKALLGQSAEYRLVGGFPPSTEYYSSSNNKKGEDFFPQRKRRGQTTMRNMDVAKWNNKQEKTLTPRMTRG